ncbi:MAG TPA: hypothetical protein VGB61_10700, partial [Pyrinomonadaceae bacterium]
GDFDAARAVSFMEVLGLNDEPKRILLDGREAGRVSFNRDARRLRLPLPDAGVSEITFVP